MGKADGPSARAEWQQHWSLVVATAMGMSFATVLTFSFGVMLGPLEAEFGWTRAEITTGPAIVSVIGFLLSAPGGYLIDKFGSRRCGAFVVVTTTIAIALMSQVDTIWQWRAAWALFGMTAGFTSTVWLAPVSAIFNAGRGMAIAFTLAGVGLSMAIVPAIAEYFVENYSWRTGFLALAGIWFVLTMPLILTLVPDRPSPANSGTEDYLDKAEQAIGLTPREGFTTPPLYLLFFASLLASMTGSALMVNAVPVLIDTGISRGQAVAIVGSMGVASIAGRLVGGVLMDHFDVRRLAICGVLMSLGLPLSLLLFPGEAWAAHAGVITYGLTGGMTMNAVVYLATTHLGHRSFGLFYGVLSITTTLAGGVGPLLANHVYDLTQSYLSVIWMTVPGFGGAALLFFLLGPAPDFAHPVANG